MNHLNLNPLKFHPVHGDFVSLSKDNTVAKRYDGFCKGIAFSHRPVAVNEYIFLKFVDISSNWSGALRIGFTAHDPITYRNNLPKYACPYMTEQAGNWARALAEHLVMQSSVLFFYVNEIGDVHYGFDHEETGVLLSGVNTSGKLWVLLDIYGNTVEIEFLGLPSYLAFDEAEVDSSEDAALELMNLKLEDTTALPSNDKCVICYDAQSDCALYRCGHAIMCYDCALEVWKSSTSHCPVCRMEITDVLKIFK